MGDKRLHDVEGFIHLQQCSVCMQCLHCVRYVYVRTCKCTTYGHHSLIVSHDSPQPEHISRHWCNCTEWPVGKGTNICELQYHPYTSVDCMLLSCTQWSQGTQTLSERLSLVHKDPQEQTSLIIC